MAALASDWLRLFQLLLWNCWTEFDKTWQEARTHPLPSLCFWADQKTKMATLASDKLRHFQIFLWNHWMEFNITWQEARTERPLSSLCFSGRSENQDGCPGLWLTETFFISLSMRLLNILPWGGGEDTLWWLDDRLDRRTEISWSGMSRRSFLETLTGVILVWITVALRPELGREPCLSLRPLNGRTSFSLKVLQR